MKSKHLTLLVGGYILIYLLAVNWLKNPLSLDVPLNTAPQSDEEVIYVSVNNDKVALEEYVLRVVASEMPANFELEALKAQAVAARSFVVSRNLNVGDTTASQVCKSMEDIKKTFKGDFEKKIAKIQSAVDATKDEIMVYNNQVVNALYFSTSNGYTVNSEDYYVASTAYLREVDSKWDLDLNPNVVATKEISKKELMKAFDIKSLKSFKIISRFANNRVKEVQINGISYTGREIREKLALRSTDFTISVSGDNYTIKTVGYGHGVGMSQYGANGMALEKANYQEILHHYYQNVEIIKYNLYKQS